MKHLPFKILAVCILAPPFLYVFCLAGLERYLTKHFYSELNSVYTADSALVLSGQTRLEDAVAANIDAYLKQKRLLRMGVEIQVMVRTDKGLLLYPPLFENPPKEWKPQDLLSVASNNYALLSQGLELEVDVKIAHNTLVSNAILTLLAGAALAVLWYFYRAGAAQAREEDAQRHREIEDLKKTMADSEDRLSGLLEQRRHLEAELGGISQKLEVEKAKADSTENAMFEEIVALEGRLNEKQASQAALMSEIEILKYKLAQLSKQESRSLQANLKTAEVTARRFSSLYKRLEMRERAIRGFLELPENMKLKAEEILQQLNYAPDMVTIKRKVFSKKNSETVLEAEFAYKGRIYFRKTNTNQVEVIAIGTKHTQNRDLECVRNIG